MNLTRNRETAGEVGGEHERPFEDSHQPDHLVGVVVRNRLGDLRDPLPEVMGRNQDFERGRFWEGVRIGGDSVVHGLFLACR